MNDIFASSLLPNTVLQIAAQAYGANGYSSNNYNGSDITSTPPPTPAPEATATTGPAAPLTGYFAEPPIFTFPLLLVVAIIVGSLSFIIGHQLRKQRRK